MSLSQPQSSLVSISDSWSARVSRACAKIVVYAFLPYAGRAQVTPQQASLPQHHGADQRSFNTNINSDDGVRAVARACLRGWHKWRRGAGTAMTSLGMVAVLICIVVLGYRRRSHNHRALGLPCGAIHQTRQRQVGASRPEVPSALGSVLRECELDSVSQLVEPGASAVPDRCAICLEAMTLGFRDDACGVSSSSSSNALLRVLRCEHRFHAQCVDPWLTTCCALCPMCKSDTRK
ncbi:hypothetical protein GGI03_003034 [Coemansia sp. RSA 2337]|nr:hypothetical protein GGI03_003034 [Coemansia sp. RSA 2337]